MHALMVRGWYFISLSSSSAAVTQLFIQSGWPAVHYMGTVNAMVNFKQLYPFGSNLQCMYRLTGQVVDSDGSTGCRSLMLERSQKIKAMASQ